jgi:hypothetical protein
MIDDARFSLEVALSEYATIAPQTEREWKAERQAYRATALARPIPKNIKLEFTPPISWTEKETS